ncbi:MAG TPA: TlyA family RNA methyltransferase [Kiritimatiellia bacterium]|jgi:23S rRNA (cytidine1920-2'-O)/16S rRNA (cytidine1409-2'-O)-methyltransferase|nr:MAG: Hemolysin A [Verrucomicrobia bacterium ADurb.Bin018]HOE01336.1 TlyA family RNA methyltransferase [Kiritimatiellia bacterium]HOE37205.1 TlyA family RNA methyltransferase [Kiritimatiellia bacterium]HOR74656.1 TlyA family RNA methyltransferase [Kiritimatiellia bacterium]HOU59145.1 TlyA family RNA methyltransferase [Kiritimatiellia bacterium]
MKEPRAKRQRLDLLLVARGLAESREKAQRLILAGEVFVNDAPATKPGHEVPEDCALRVREPERFVSRGGLKLEAAFAQFAGLSAAGRVCVDIGASTGGFTDCLLQHGAARVYAVDVGKLQLHPRLVADPRVVVLDGCNARNLQPGDLPETPDMAVTDVSFISLQLILPAIDRLLKPGGEVVALIKPQFEAGREEVGKGGVIRDPALRQRIVARIREFGTQTLGWQWLGGCESPIQGPAGNVEFLSYWQKPAAPRV